jgi:opacity protein-like surface antigen
MKKLLFTLVALLPFAISSAANAAVVQGAQGQTLTVSAITAKSGAMITVSGNGFDESVGIYLAFCVVPKKGELPTPCGGGINKAGLGEASFWISSNPPPYAIGLTKEFLPGGRFTEKVQVSRKIGKFDCAKVKCAITIRADHLRGNDRSFDMFVPVKIK